MNVAGAEVVAFVGAVLATAVPLAEVVLLATGKGAAMVMVSGAIDDVTLLTTGAEDVVTGVEEALTGVEEATLGVEEATLGVEEEVTGAAEALPLGPTHGMVSM